MMKLSIPPSSVLLSLVLFLEDSTAPAADRIAPDDAKAVAVDQRWLLFFDVYIFPRPTVFPRFLHPPRAMGVVTPADNPGESVGASRGLVGRRKDGTFFA